MPSSYPLMMSWDSQIYYYIVHLKRDQATLSLQNWMSYKRGASVQSTDTQTANPVCKWFIGVTIGMWHSTKRRNVTKNIFCS